MDPCVSVAKADGNIRAMPWLSEIPPLSSFPSLLSLSILYSLYLCASASFSVVPGTAITYKDCLFVNLVIFLRPMTSCKVAVL